MLSWAITFLIIALIAAALGCHRDTVSARARREWRDEDDDFMDLRVPERKH